ncbi:MAG: hypothetical protein L0H63_05950 [Nitrococcus sp.]|nr:hypothetical protein [Nitrococcus sp.]
MSSNTEDRVEQLAQQLSRGLDRIEAAAPFAKANHLARIWDVAIRLLKKPTGVEALYAQASRFDSAGVFYGGDWDQPASLQPSLVTTALHGQAHSIATETLSELRLLAIATGEADSEAISAAEARGFLESVLALNLDLLFTISSEASRAQRTPLTEGIHRLFRFIADRLGMGGVLASLVEEAARLLLQQPIMVHRIKAMIEAAAHGLPEVDNTGVRDWTLQLIHAVHGPTPLARDNEAPASYARALEGLDADGLSAEARAFALSMDATGLACPQHAVLLRHLNEHGSNADLALALGLDSVGRDSLDAYAALVHRLINAAVYPETAHCLYGLARLLERGVLFFPPAAPGLWRLLQLELKPEVAKALVGQGGPSPLASLVAGTLSVLGQPLGVGQGDNPTCQSARAISLWSQSDPGFLLELITWAARDNEIDMHFEGALLRSSELQSGLVEELHTELDPVSLVLVPHLDRIYAEMGRRCAGRDEDGHKWINPEFHGWWVHRGFATCIQYASGDVIDFEGFMRLFHATYHPAYNDGRGLIYPQPAGIAATDSHGNYIGAHAVTIQRVAIDRDDVIRVYFYNPNNDSGQDWGQGIVTSTHGHQEFPGESSLAFEQFAARLYVFHYNLREQGDPAAVPAQEVERIATLVRESWARNVGWHTVVTATAGQRLAQQLLVG